MECGTENNEHGEAWIAIHVSGIVHDVHDDLAPVSGLRGLEGMARSLVDLGIIPYYGD